MPTLQLIPNSASLTVIRLTIRSEANYFIVDTGASKTHVCPLLLTGVTNDKIRSAIAINTTQTRRSSIVEQQFNFCGVSIHEVVVDTYMYKIPDERLGFTYSGLIGQDLLRQFKRIHIDYVQSTITFEL